MTAELLKNDTSISAAKVIKNKEKAFKILKTRLYDLKLREREEAEGKERRSKIGTGDRSEKIRTYNFPQGRVTDHRIGYTTHDLQGFRGGDIQDMIDALTVAENAERMKESEL